MDDPASARTPASARSTLRSILVVVVGTVAVLGVLASTLAVWARVTLFDTQRVGAVAVDVLRDPDVNAALAAYVTEQAIEVSGVDGRIHALLPPSMQPLAAPVLAGTEDLVDGRVEQILVSEPVLRVTRALVEDAHRALLRLLDGGGLGKGVDVEAGVVSIDLLPLVGRALEALQARGLLGDVQVPRLDGADRTTQLDRLAAALHRRLPDDFGRLVAYRPAAVDRAESTLRTAQDAVVLFRRAVVALVLVTLALLAAAVGLARDRRRAALGLVLGTVAGLLVARIATRKVLGALPTAFADPGAGKAAAAIGTGLTAGLARLTFGLVVLGLVVALVLVVLGPGDDAVAVRRALGSGSGAVAAPVRRHRGATSIVVFAAALLALDVLGISVVGVVVAGVLAATGIWLQAGSTRPAPERPSGAD